MSVDTQELIELCDQLPEAKRAELIDFARFLKSRYANRAELDGDARWEAIIADPRPRPKFDAFMKASMEEGGLEPLDPDKL